MSSCFRSPLSLSLSGNCIGNGGEIQMHPDDLIMMAPLRATKALQDDGRAGRGANEEESHLNGVQQAVCALCNEPLVLTRSLTSATRLPPSNAKRRTVEEVAFEEHAFDIAPFQQLLPKRRSKNERKVHRQQQMASFR